MLNFNKIYKGWMPYRFCRLKNRGNRAERFIMRIKIIFIISILQTICPVCVLAQVDPNPASVDFGTIDYNSDSPQINITLTNNHGTNVFLSSFTFSNTSFALVIASGSTTLEPGDSIIYRIRVAETAVGTYNATLTFTFDAVPDVVIPLTASIDYPADASWIFYFLQEIVHIDCQAGDDFCQGIVPFEVATLNGCNGFASPNDFAAQVSAEIELTFNPCNLIYHPDLLGDPSFGMVYEQKNGGCLYETGAECEIVAVFDRPNISLVSQDCQLRGNLAFTITGQDNVAQCTNLTVQRERQAVDPDTQEPLFEPDGQTPIMETYDYQTEESFFLATMAIAHFPVSGGTSATDNIQIAVTRLGAPDVEDITDLNYYSAFLKVSNIDNTVPSLDFILRFKNSAGSFVALPSNVTINQIEWILDGVVDHVDIGALINQWNGYVFDPSSEHIVRAVVYATFTNGLDQTFNVIMSSNELRLYTPDPFLCEDESAPVITTIPPTMSPVGAPNRPIYTNVSGDTIKVPDYMDYTGGGDVDYVPNGFWHGGAARNGIWDPWINDNTLRVGRKVYTFTNALPWEIYQLCPIPTIALPTVSNGETVTLPGTSFGYYNACADPQNLSCPMENDGTVAWNLTWTVYGWLCIKHTCLLQQDANPRPGAGEAWNCDE